MRCLYCSKRLPLLKKLTGGGEFCSEAHRQSYHEEYNRLALSRLLQAQTRPEEPARPARAEQAPEAAPEKALWADPKFMAGPVREPLPARDSKAGAAITQPGVWRPGEPDLPATSALPAELELAAAGLVPEPRIVLISSGTAALAIAGAGALPAALDCVLPEHKSEFRGEVRPAQAGLVEVQTDPMPPETGEVRGPEPEMPVFRPVLEFAVTMEPVWTAGLAFDPAGRSGGTPFIGTEPDSEWSQDAGETEPQIAAVACMEAPQPSVEPEPAAPQPATQVDLQAVAATEPEPEVEPEYPVPEAAAEPVRRAGAIVPWLPIEVKPAPMANKPRLMQSFQAVAMIHEKPQIPAFDVLPLRPRMTLAPKPEKNGAEASLSGSNRAAARQDAPPSLNGAGNVTVLQSRRHAVPAGRPSTMPDKRSIAAVALEEPAVAAAPTRKMPAKAATAEPPVSRIANAGRDAQELTPPSFSTLEDHRPSAARRLARWLNISHGSADG